MNKTVLVLTFTIALIAFTIVGTPPIVAQQQNTFRSNFNTPSELQSWTQLKIPGWFERWRSIQVRGGELVIEPKAISWYEDVIGGHVYRQVSGDFMITTRLNVTGTRSALPQTQYSLAGILVRAPRALTAQNWQRGRENWVFLSAGTANPPGQAHLEIKTTQNSQSSLEIVPNKQGQQELRVVRNGSTFYMLQRYIGGQWQVLKQFNRPDMPNTLWIGVTAYSDWPSTERVYPNFEVANAQGAPTDNSDLRVAFDFIDIRPFTVGANIMQSMMAE